MTQPHHEAVWLFQFGNTRVGYRNPLSDARRSEVFPSLYLGKKNLRRQPDDRRSAITEFAQKRGLVELADFQSARLTG